MRNECELNKETVETNSGLQLDTETRPQSTSTNSSASQSSHRAPHVAPKQEAKPFTRVARHMGSLAVVAVFGLAMLGSEPWQESIVEALSPLAFQYYGAPNIIIEPASSINASSLSKRASTEAGSAAATGVGLQRQTDCSLTEYAFFPNSSGASSSFTISTVPNFQQSLHTQAGLTTTGGIYPNGCKDQELGIPSRYGAVLGLTKDGSSEIGAYIDDNNNLYAGTVNPTTGAYTGTELLAGTAIALLAADIEGSGYPDLLVQTFSSSSSADPITIYHNNGNGTFTAGATVLSTVPTSAFTLDDVNGDGKIDLVVSTPTQIMTLLGNGNGTFGSPITSTLPFATQGDELATGDFNGDENKDLVTTNGAILLGDGAGHFAPATSTITISANSTVVGDWNNDGKLDLAFMKTGTAGGLITIYLGNGDGTFTQGNSYATIGGVFYLSAADLDGDGNMDITVGEANGGMYGPDYNSGGSLQVVMGLGDGTFAGTQAYPNGSSSSNASASTSPVAIADFHGTGYKDMLMVTNSALELLTNNGKGAFAASTGISGTSPTQVVTADMNGDGKADAVFVESSSGSYDVAVALGEGGGTFQSKTTTSISGEATELVTSDFNGDGKLDVAVAIGNEVYLLLNQGSGTLGAPTLVATEPNPITGLVAASLRSNGKLDLVLIQATIFNATSAGAVGILLGKGDGTFGSESDIALNYSPQAVAVGDMNNDGILDLVVASSDQASLVYNLYVDPGRGDGTFGTPVTTALNFPNVKGLALARLNGDTNMDVVIPSCCGGAYTYIALGSGNGAFSNIVPLAFGASATAVALADLNGDAKPDLVLNSTATSSDLVVQLSQATSAAIAATKTALTASATSVSPGTSVTFTATVAPASGSGTPTGIVTFMDGATTLGTGAVASGVATYTTSTLSVGSNSITAVYGGDTNFATSTSTALSITVTAAVPASFTLGLSPTSGTVASGSTTTSTITITPSGGFNQRVSFACSGLPQNASCNFSPATVTPSGTGMATSTLTIATGTASMALYQPSLPSRGSGGRTALALLGGGGFLGWTLLHRRKGKKLWHLQLGFALMILAASATVGCGGRAKSTTTPTGTYQIMIVGTTGSATQSATYSLKVQ